MTKARTEPVSIIIM